MNPQMQAMLEELNLAMNRLLALRAENIQLHTDLTAVMARAEAAEAQVKAQTAQPPSGLPVETGS